MITPEHLEIHTAIQRLMPGAHVSIPADGSAIIWHDYEDEKPPFSRAHIQAEIIKMRKEYEAAQYQRDRAAAYPTWQEQQDMLYHDQKNGTTVWYDTIEAIKQKYPKPAV